MAVTGRLVAFYGAGEPMRIEEYPVPEPEPGAIVVRTTLANVCGSDLHVWRGDQDLKKMGRALPRHLGHEQCGQVHALGDGVTTDSAGAPLSVGDRVIFRYAFACGRCRACLTGKTRCCPNQMRHTATPCTVWPYFKGAWADCSTATNMGVGATSTAVHKSAMPMAVQVIETSHLPRATFTGVTRWISVPSA